MSHKDSIAIGGASPTLQDRVAHLCVILSCILMSTLSAGIVSAEGTSFVFMDWSEPRWVSGLDGGEGSVRIQTNESIAEVSVLYTYPSGKTGAAVCEWDKEDEELFHFSVPGHEAAGYGDVAYVIEVLYGAHGTDRALSETRRVPMSYAEELDITGPAAKALLFPLAGDDFMVRYIPCCNIYGGMTYAERVPVNPTEIDEGLPDTLVSDFVIIEPDGLSASTMGLYFDFTYDAETIAALGDAGLALYEFDMKSTWYEVISYEIDEALRKVTVHYPDGGIMVLGKKQ